MSKKTPPCSQEPIPRSPQSCKLHVHRPFFPPPLMQTETNARTTMTACTTYAIGLKRENPGHCSLAQPIPPPCSTTVCLSSFSTFRLSRLRSSGLMTFSSAAADASASGTVASLPVVAAFLPFAVAAFGGASGAGFRWRTLGAGKLCLRSMASTVRWKRRKSFCARRRVEGRSMVLESSLTVAVSLMSKGLRKGESL